MYISGHSSQAGIMLTYNQQLLMFTHQQLLLCVIEPQLQLAASIKHNWVEGRPSFQDGMATWRKCMRMHQFVGLTLTIYEYSILFFY